MSKVQISRETVEVLAKVLRNIETSSLTQAKYIYSKAPLPPRQRQPDPSKVTESQLRVVSKVYEKLSEPRQEQAALVVHYATALHTRKIARELDGALQERDVTDDVAAGERQEVQESAKESSDGVPAEACQEEQHEDAEEEGKETSKPTADPAAGAGDGGKSGNGDGGDGQAPPRRSSRIRRT